MNAETRAKELTTELVEASGLRPGAVGWLWDDHTQAAITAALTRAENDKLEAAARAAQAAGDMWKKIDGDPTRADCGSAISRLIRSLKKD